MALTTGSKFDAVRAQLCRTSQDVPARRPLGIGTRPRGAVFLDRTSAQQIVVSCRVWRAGQKADLASQRAALEQFCIAAGQAGLSPTPP